MLGVILNIIGIILIILSLFYIIKLEAKENNDFQGETIFYHELEGDLQKSHEELNGIYNLLDKKSNEIKFKLEAIEKNYKTYEESTSMEIPSDKLESNDLFYKIKELKDIGLTNEEIAKKLNKGVREIEITLSLHN